MGLLAQVLQGVEDGSIDEDDACEHLMMILDGEAGEKEDDSPEEQDAEDEDEDYMEDEEEDDDEKDEDPYMRSKTSIRDNMPKDPKNFGKQNHPGKRPVYRGVTGTKRNTEGGQKGI
jgi:hypothetical protein